MEVDANLVIAALREQLSSAHYDLAIATARVKALEDAS